MVHPPGLLGKPSSDYGSQIDILRYDHNDTIKIGQVLEMQKSDLMGIRNPGEKTAPRTKKPESDRMKENQPQREHPSTYFVQDRSNEEELRRLELQDQMLTEAMGGVFPEQANPTLFHHILDVGSGTGGWLISVAKTHPTISVLAGVDVSMHMVEHAREQALAAQVADRVEFHAGDALRRLEFPASFFDLVNIRLGVSFLRTWDWPKLLQEIQRVTKSHGIIRVTDAEIGSESNSPALNKLHDLFTSAFYRAGHLFTPDPAGLTTQLPALLQRSGYQYVQTHTYELEYRTGTTSGNRYYQDIELVFRTARPFLSKWANMPDDYEALYQQALEEMQRPDFRAVGHVLTVWGGKRRVKRHI